MAWKHALTPVPPACLIMILSAYIFVQLQHLLLLIQILQMVFQQFWNINAMQLAKQLYLEVFSLNKQCIRNTIFVCPIVMQQNQQIAQLSVK